MWWVRMKLNNISVPVIKALAIIVLVGITLSSGYLQYKIISQSCSCDCKTQK